MQVRYWTKEPNRIDECPVKRKLIILVVDLNFLPENPTGALHGKLGFQMPRSVRN